MRIAIIGRTEILCNTALLLRKKGHDIALIITAKEAPEYGRAASDFQDLANEWKVPCLITSRSADAADILTSLPMIHIGVSINYPGIIPQSVIDLFPLGILNAHGGDLPRYRGNACQAWAILNGESRIGLCVHKMIGDELDSGDIIVREYLPIDINTKITQAWEWMSQRVPQMMVEAVDRLDSNPHFVLERQSRDPKEALRCYPRLPEDGRIDWSRPAADILRLINASNRPYAGAFCEFEGRKLIIWDASLVEDHENFLAAPGQVTEIGNGYVKVAAGKGKLCLREVEYDKEITTPDKRIRSMRTRLRQLKDNRL